MIHAGLDIVKKTVVSLPSGCVVVLGRARVDSSNPMLIFYFFVFD